MLNWHDEQKSRNTIERYAEEQRHVTTQRPSPQSLDEYRRVLGDIVSVDFAPGSRPSWLGTTGNVNR
ncbi:hypothetical protein [Aeoliella sp. SH292]|uniref:hypothetical protein n=1 Tax=Aeoliella sp. SH292 TaxID=3454464 RepID=UPI003F9C4DBB